MFPISPKKQKQLLFGFPDPKPPPVPSPGSDPGSCGADTPREALLENVLFRNIKIQLGEIFHPKILKWIKICVIVRILFLFRMLFSPQAVKT